MAGNFPARVHHPVIRNIVTRKQTSMKYSFKSMDSPVGTLTLVANGNALAAILWENDTPGRVPLGELVEEPDVPVLQQAEQQLREYFSGKRQEFSIKMEFSGTEFQRKVWAALTKIPFGDTRSYTDIANQIGHPGAVRAVGAANGKNPISIMAACHRVIGANGKLTGFAGGLEAKAYLLNLEATNCGKADRQLPGFSPEGRVAPDSKKP